MYTTQGEFICQNVYENFAANTSTMNPSTNKNNLGPKTLNGSSANNQWVKPSFSNNKPSSTHISLPDPISKLTSSKTSLTPSSSTNITRRQ